MTHRLSQCGLVALLTLAGSVGATRLFAGSGLNLGWGPYCPTTINSAVDEIDPCDGSSGATYELIGSFRSPIALPSCVTEEVDVQFQTASQFLLDYWHIEDENQYGLTNPAGCRGTNSATGNKGSMRVSAADGDFPTVFAPCVRFWGTSPAGVVNYLPGLPSPSYARLKMAWTRATGSPMKAQPSQYGSFVIFIDTNHQTGLDPHYPPPKYACEGCLRGACINYLQCILRQTPGAPGGDITITKEDIRRFVAWQGGNELGGCAPTPVKRATWGRVKSLYR